MKAENSYRSLALSILTAIASTSLAEPLEEIVVSAQKREQNIQDVGISISAFSGDRLAELGITRTEELVDITPGLVMNSGGRANITTFSLRAVSQRDIADHQEAPVVVYSDGAYVSMRGGAGFGTYDVERIEILKGPQGTLFGRNATGGLIHVISKRPTDEFEALARFTAGEYSQFGSEIAVSGPLSEAVRGRLSFYSNVHDGWIDNRASGEETEDSQDISARGQLEFDIGDNGGLLLNVRTADTSGVTPRVFHALPNVIEGGFSRRPTSAEEFAEYCNNSLASNMGFGMFTSPLTPDEIADLKLGNGLPVTPPPGAWQNGNCYHAEPDDDPYSGSSDDPGFYESTFHGFTGTLELETRGGMQFTSITDFQTLDKEFDEDLDSTPFPLVRFDQFTEIDQFSQELRLSMDGDSHRWVAGLYYLSIDNDSQSSTDRRGDPNQGLDLGNAYSQETQSWAVFGQAEYDFSDELTAVFGFRWTEDSIEHRSVGSCSPHPLNGFIPPFTFGPGQTEPISFCDFLGDADFFPPISGLFADTPQFTGIDDKTDDGDWSGKLQLNWRPGDDVLVYLGVTRANKAGGFNNGGATLYPNASVRYDQEVLVSYEAGFKSTLADGRVQLNGSAYYYDYNDYQTFFTETAQLRLFNVDANVVGGELELVAQPTDSLMLQFGLNVMESEQEELPALGGADGTISQVMPDAPEIMFSGLGRYEWPLLGGTAHVQVDFRYTDEKSTGAYEYPDFFADSYTRVNARIGFSGPDDRWDVALWGKNLTDDVVTFANVATGRLFGGTFSIVDKPRWVGITGTYRW